VIFIQVIFFEFNLEIKENIISRGSIFGTIGVGLLTKDRNCTQQSYPRIVPKKLLRVWAWVPAINLFWFL
jgi:hypothetical protein